MTRKRRLVFFSDAFLLVGAACACGAVYMLGGTPALLGAIAVVCCLGCWYCEDVAKGRYNPDATPERK